MGSSPSLAPWRRSYKSLVVVEEKDETFPSLFSVFVRSTETEQIGGQSESGMTLFLPLPLLHPAIDSSFPTHILGHTDTHTHALSLVPPPSQAESVLHAMPPGKEGL